MSEKVVEAKKCPKCRAFDLFQHIEQGKRIGESCTGWPVACDYYVWEPGARERESQQWRTFPGWDVA